MPENTIKFAVGVLLTSFGCFWAAEGAGVEWPGDEAALLGVIAFFAASSFALVARAPPPANDDSRGRGRRVSRLRSFARFWWDFIVGDDWRVAAGLAVAVGFTWVLSHRGHNAWWLLPLAVVVLLADSLRRATRDSK